MEALHPPGEIIAERYRITDTLGQGGVGITYAAQDLKSGQQVALKALSVRQMGDWKVLELFEREAKILAQLEHPAIPRYLDYFHVDTPEDRSYYIAQELAEGKSLAELVEIGWRTNESGARRIVTQILEILVYLHELKPPVVHRDIKPQNLVWGQNAKVFLVDFGAVQDTYRSTLVKGSTIIGTYGYMAPEQFLGQAVPATDLYGLGATILFLLTHRSPSDLPQERLKISFRSRIQVSEGFADWLEKMLEPDVDDRFSSAKDALAALQGRMVIAKKRSSLPWKGILGVGVAAVTAVTVLNSFRWVVLSPLGFQPSGICDAANSGNLDVVRDYLKHGGDLNAKDDGEYPIMPCLLKMKNAQKDIAELVIAKLPDVNAKDSLGQTLLYVTGSREIAKLMIAKGADVNAKDYGGNTPLHRALSKEVAQLLIVKGADVNAKNISGGTPLHSVVLDEDNRNDVAQVLIAMGADVNAKDKQGNTPLHQARSKEVAQLLIVKGADVNAKNNRGRTPLYTDKLYGLTPPSNWNDLAQLLIAKGADVKAKDDEGYTPLHWAVFLQRNDVVELLIAKGADVKAKDKQGRTPLHQARSENVAQLLIAKGADVNAKNNDGATPLHTADSNKIALLLIAMGADVNAKDNNGATPLHTVDSNEIPLLLIAMGADVKAKDKQGRTPLHQARSKEVAQLLIVKGADVKAKDKQGRTPLHQARSKEVAQLLIAQGADVNAKDNWGNTPLYMALREGDKGDKKVIELLKSHGGTT